MPEVAHSFVINGSGGVRMPSRASSSSPGTSAQRTQKQVLADLSPRFLKVPQAKVQAFSPPALPGSTGGAPMQFVIRTTGDYETLADVARDDAAGRARERALPVHRRRPEVRHAAVQVQGRRRQGERHGHQHGRRRQRARDHARRQLRQPVQPLRAQLPGHPAGPARVPPDARLADPLPASHPQRRTRAAVGGRERVRRGPAERADELPAAQFRDPLRRAVSRAARSARRSTSSRRSRRRSSPRAIPTISAAIRASTSRRATRSSPSSSSR